MLIIMIDAEVSFLFLFSLRHPNSSHILCLSLSHFSVDGAFVLRGSIW